MCVCVWERERDVHKCEWDVHSFRAVSCPSGARSPERSVLFCWVFLTCPDWVIVLRSVNAASLYWSGLSCRPHFLQCELSLDLPPKTRANSFVNTTVLWYSSETCSPRQLLFVLKTQFKNVILAYEILLQFKITVFYLNVFLKYNLFMWCKAVFSASLLQSPVSHDLQKSFYDNLPLTKHFFILSMLKTVFTA